MVVDEPNRDELRQGDVCAPAWFPTWNVNEHHLVTQIEGSARRLLVGVTGREPHPVVVCSHDCDIENVGNKTGFGALLVAPAMPWPSGVAEGDIPRLRESSRMREDNRYEYIGLFPLQLSGDEWRIVNFSSMTTISPAKALPRFLLDRKEYEMTDEWRSLFRAKLAAFFARPDANEAAE